MSFVDPGPAQSRDEDEPTHGHVCHRERVQKDNYETKRPNIYLANHQIRWSGTHLCFARLQSHRLKVRKTSIRWISIHPPRLAVSSPNVHACTLISIHPTSRTVGVFYGLSLQHSSPKLASKGSVHGCAYHDGPRAARRTTCGVPYAFACTPSQRPDRLIEPPFHSNLSVR